MTARRKAKPHPDDTVRVEDGLTIPPEECWIYLIWGLKKNVCDLLAIASSAKTRDRYIEFGNRHGYLHVQAERVMTGHLYGQNMLGSAYGRKIRSHP